MKRRLKNCGFVLLITLALILIAGVVLIGFARKSIVVAMESRDAVQELQHRWAVTSCSAAFGGSMEEILDTAERGDAEEGKYANKPISELHIKCQLGGMDFILALTDEQSKINVNNLFEKIGRGETELIVRKLARRKNGCSESSATIKLMPLVLRDNSSEMSGTLKKFSGYGQIFEKVLPECIFDETPKNGLAANITCWGSGAVNIRRASSGVIEQACGKIMSGQKLKNLLLQIQANPYSKLPELLGEADIKDEEMKKQLANVLTDRSECHGLWVVSCASGRWRYGLKIFQSAENGEKSSNANDSNETAVVNQFGFAW